MSNTVHPALVSLTYYRWGVLQNLLHIVAIELYLMNCRLIEFVKAGAVASSISYIIHVFSACTRAHNNNNNINNDDDDDDDDNQSSRSLCAAVHYNKAMRLSYLTNRAPTCN